MSFAFWLLTICFFGLSKIDEVVLDASKTALMAFIKDIDVEETDVGSDIVTERFKQIDWDSVARKYRSLDKALERVWSLECAGWLVLVRVGMLFLISAVYAAVSLGDTTTYVMVGARVLSLVFAGGGVVALFRIAKVTALWSEKTSTSNSIPAAVSKYIGHTSGVSEEKRYSFRLFRAYVYDNPIGIEVFGVPISKSLVFSLFTRTFIYIPICLSILSPIVYDRDFIEHLRERWGHDES